MPTVKRHPGRRRGLAGVGRVLGRVEGSPAGPTLLVVGGIHGNEPAGVLALQRVLEWLASREQPLRGRLVALTGNLAALERGVRYVEHDLNRCWSRRRVEELRGPAPPAECAEDLEQLALLGAIDEVLDSARDEVFFLDLHTSSAIGGPFVTVGDTLRNRRFAQSFPLPLILGLEEQVDGALLEYLNNLGLITVGVEAGQHDAPEAVEHLEAVILLALVNTGLLDDAALADAARLRSRLQAAAGPTPPVVEVRHRHAIQPERRFVMNPGFSNFEPVRAGQPLARDRDGEIRAPEAGLLLLPLYQGQGDDGFFVAREVKPFWLTVSALLRRLRISAAVRLLPGVWQHPEWEGTLVVDTRVARFFPLEILHLLGYRKLRRQGSHLLVNRRRFDLAPPRRPCTT